MSEQSFPAQAVIFQFIMGPWIAQALGAVARLGVADQLAAGPKTSAQLAEAVGANTDALNRTLRALAGVGVFTSPAPGSWALAPLGECLRTDVPGSLRHLVIAETDHGHWGAWERFSHAVRTGAPQAEAALGCKPWEYYAAHPEDGEAFSKAMANISSIAIGPVLS